MNIAVDTLLSRIWKVIDIHKEAEDVTNIEILGILELLKLDVYREIRQKEEEKEARK